MSDEPEIYVSPEMDNALTALAEARGLDKHQVLRNAYKVLKYLDEQGRGPELVDEPTKQRPGDQVLPSGDESLIDDQALVIQDIEARRQVGIERYGQGHRPFNGRDTLEDLYEEQLDFLVYFRSLKRMAEASREDVIDAIAGELRRTGFQAIVVEALAEQIYTRLQGWIAANIMKENRD